VNESAPTDTDEAGEDPSRAAEPTTRRESVSSRIAKAWRRTPHGTDASDSQEPDDVISESQLAPADHADATADDGEGEGEESPATEDQSAPADPSENDAPQPVGAARGRPAGPGHEDESQSWLF
jgi:hypothetical protein